MAGSDSDGKNFGAAAGDGSGDNLFWVPRQGAAVAARCYGYRSSEWQRRQGVLATAVVAAAGAVVATTAAAGIVGCCDSAVAAAGGVFGCCDSDSRVFWVSR